MEVRFLSLGSGSSGNCYYLATKTCGILIDAGIGIRSIKKVFKDYALNLDIRYVRYLLLTTMPTISRLLGIWQRNIIFLSILHLRCMPVSTGVIV